MCSSVLSQLLGPGATQAGKGFSESATHMEESGSRRVGCPKTWPGSLLTQGKSSNSHSSITRDGGNVPSLLRGVGRSERNGGTRAPQGQGAPQVPKFQSFTNFLAPFYLKKGGYSLIHSFIGENEKARSHITAQIGQMALPGVVLVAPEFKDRQALCSYRLSYLYSFPLPSFSLHTPTERCLSLMSSM